MLQFLSNLLNVIVFICLRGFTQSCSIFANYVFIEVGSIFFATDDLKIQCVHL